MAKKRVGIAPRFRDRWVYLYGVRLADVARKSGMSERHLSRCLSGESGMGLALAVRVAKVMGVTVEELGGLVEKARMMRVIKEAGG